MTAPLDLTPLRARFLDRLALRTATLQGYLAVLSCVADDADSIDAAMLAFHAIAGVAGTYDLREITTLARRAEWICADALEQGALRVEDLEQLLSIVNRLSSIGAMERPARSKIVLADVREC